MWVRSYWVCDFIHKQYRHYMDGFYGVESEAGEVAYIDEEYHTGEVRLLSKARWHSAV